MKGVTDALGLPSTVSTVTVPKSIDELDWYVRAHKELDEL